MNFNEQTGQITLDAYDLIHSIPTEQQKSLIESLSCSDQIIRHVMDQVFYGLTDNGFGGGVWLSGHAEDNSAIVDFQRKIALKANEIAEKHILRLEAKNKELTDKVDYLLKTQYNRDY